MMDQFDQRYFLYQRVRDYESIPGIEQIWGEGDHSAWRRSEPLLKRVNTVSEGPSDIQTLRCAPDPAVRALGEAGPRSITGSLTRPTPSTSTTIQYEALRLLRTQPQVREALQQAKVPT